MVSLTEFWTWRLLRKLWKLQFIMKSAPLFLAFPRFLSTRFWIKWIEFLYGSTGLSILCVPTMHILELVRIVAKFIWLASKIIFAFIKEVYKYLESVPRQWPFLGVWRLRSSKPIGSALWWCILDNGFKVIGDASYDLNGVRLIVPARCPQPITLKAIGQPHVRLTVLGDWFMCRASQNL